MPELRNTTSSPIKASTGHAVPPEGALTVDEATLKRLQSERYIAVQIKLGRLEVYPDPVLDARGSAINREAIALACREDLLELILAHYDVNVEAADFDSVSTEGEDGLRGIAARLIFADL